MKYSLLVSCVFASALSAHGYQIATDGHVDIQLVYAGGKLAGKVVSDNGLVSREETLLFDGPAGSTSVARPGGSQWDFLGVKEGESLYFWPQGTLQNRIYLGFASDKSTVPLGAFASYHETDPRINGTAAWNKITLLAVRFQPAPEETAGPAHFSLWSNSFDGTTVWMSSFENGITADDATWLLVGGHEHYNWGFTKRGYYQIDFQFSGYLNDGPKTYVESAPQTYHFGVEFMPETIPEPGSAALLVGGLAIVGLRRCRSIST